MNDQSDTFVESASLRLLRRLVILLLVTMIAGFAIMTTLFVIKLTAFGSLSTTESTASDANSRSTNSMAPTEFPDRIAVPEGQTVTALTRGDGWIAVVTDDSRILVFDSTGQELLKVVEIAP